MTAKVLIYCNENVLNYIEDLDLKYDLSDGQIEVLVDDNNISDDEEFVSFYGIDYNDVNCIEAYNFCAV